MDEYDLNGIRFYCPVGNKPTYQPGDISEHIYNNFDTDSEGYDLNRVKCNVIKDLYAVGYTGVLIHNNIQNVDAYNSMLSNINFLTQELICFRVGTSDYHFMRYDSATSAWYNKIGDGLIFEYTDNNGIPSNDVPWGASEEYDSDIIYVVYNKLKIDLTENGQWERNITVKGGVTDISANNYIFCCGDVACCNPNGICECENEVINGGKDVIYEIVIPESATYNIQLSTEYSDYYFNYEIYSYNMYNGNYAVLKEGNGNSTTTVSETVNLITYENVEDPYQVYKYYLRLDFGKNNTSDQSVNVSISHTHEYNYNYEQSTSTQHEAYCWCGEHELQDHDYNYVITDSHHTKVCSCGAVDLESEEHHRSYCVSKNQDLHYVYCKCGYLIEEDTHDMVPTGKLNMSACRDCGYLRNDSNTGAVIKGEKDNPEVETE